MPILPIIYLAAIFAALMIVVWVIAAVPLYRMRVFLDSGTAQVRKTHPPVLEGVYRGRAAKLTNDLGSRRQEGKFSVNLECRSPHRIALKRKPRVLSLALVGWKLVRKTSPTEEFPGYEMEGGQNDWAVTWLAQPEVSSRITSLMRQYGAKRLEQIDGSLCATCPVVFSNWATWTNADAILADLFALAQSLESSP